MENIINTPIPEIPIIVEKPKTNYLNLILISFAFILFSVGVYFLGKQSVKIVEKDETVEIVPTVAPVAILPKTTPVPTSITDPTANWKTYTNNDFRMSFSYPPAYSPKETGIPKDYAMMLQGKDYKVITNDFGSRNTGTYYYLSINIACSPADIVGDKKILSTTSNSNVYAITGYEGPNYKSAVFVDHGMCYEFTCNSENGCAGIQLSEFNQILSTFKFTESKDSLVTLQNKLNQYLSANLSFLTTSEGKTINLSDYYNPEFAKYGNKTDLIKKALLDSGFVYNKELDKTIITTWTSTYKSSTNTCILNGSEENLSLICN